MFKLENTKEKTLPTEWRVKNTNFYQYLKATKEIDEFCKNWYELK